VSLPSREIHTLSLGLLALSIELTLNFLCFSG